MKFDAGKTTYVYECDRLAVLSGLSRPSFLSCVQDFINQLLSVETVITQARSLKAKFSIPEDDSGEAADELKK